MSLWMCGRKQTKENIQFLHSYQYHGRKLNSYYDKWFLVELINHNFKITAEAKGLEAEYIHNHFINVLL